MTWEDVERDVIQNTEPGSQHQHASLELLMGHRARGLTPERVMVDCIECHRKSEGVRWTHNGAICDSWGFVEEGDGRICHQCLHEGYIGDIFLPSKKQRAS